LLKEGLYYEDIKNREAVIASPPDWIAKKISKAVKIKRIDQPFEIYSDFTIEYDGTVSEVFQKHEPPTDDEIEAYCAGVDAERERIIDVLVDFCDKETIDNIEKFLSRQSNKE